MQNLGFLYWIIIAISFLIASVRADAGPLIKYKYAPIIKKVKVGVYLIDISDISLVESSYRMDFYLSFFCTPNCSNLKFQLVNGKIISKEKLYDSRKYKFYKIEAFLQNTFNFRQYPFDSHILNLIIEDQYLSINQLLFTVDQKNTAIDNNVVLLGWNARPYWEAKAVNYDYTIYNSIHSRYLFSVFIDKPILAGILKTILPAIFIMMIGFLTLFVRVSEIFSGLTLAGGLLVSMILLHINTTSYLPSLRYMTFIDGFMLVNYFGLLVILIQLVVLMRMRAQLVEKLERKFLFITTIMWLFFQLINCVFFFNNVSIV